MQCNILCDRGQGPTPKGAALVNLSLSALSLAAHITGLKYQGGFLCCVSSWVYRLAMWYVVVVSLVKGKGTAEQFAATYGLK